MNATLKIRELTFMATILTLGVFATCLGDGWVREPIESLQTVQGLLQIDQVGVDGFRVFVTGHLIEELEAYGVQITNTLPAAPSPQYILLESTTGGGSCPSRYRLLDLTPGRKPYLTEEFGNCSAWPAMVMQGEDVAIRFSNFSDSKARTFIYEPNRRHLTSHPA